MVTARSELDHELLKYARNNLRYVPDTPEYNKMISGMLYDPMDPLLEDGRAISSDLSVDFANILVGDNFYANYSASFLDVSLILIGDNCLLGPNVTLCTAGHPLDVNYRAEGQEFGLPIKIGDHCWLGANCVILPGVTLGDNVVVGAGAVVTKDVESNTLVLGVPAKVVKKLNTLKESSI
ncbi:hypothetical protein KL949_000760 [Ogataea haglerorum]|uniref:Maltose/galactoside acetyltransferase domain-containing protein n=1 Tax=Ogataea haglerorum TaxID=1937702 RepID=A0ABQ7R9Y9_9ASCO|nr:hypothetical protein KL950_000007 [Ogataea haglerorum]KAG7722187.1 hypothetical protein KL913_000007 [Ogataea haglerorum]KAG7723710.1 hypothetical protein KL949_000760 [Ogataea haglerorum]KAG7761589.1 hypothetical protein KL947_000537 [Ogataea haglerorum]KAG7762013.1 hypothetical protein KL946_005059 [Ogataea haglerorum]